MLFLAAARIMLSSPNPIDLDASTLTVRDPVCDREIDVADAAEVEVYDGWAYYFCSASCHQTFRASPVSFAGSSRGPTQNRRDHHG